MKFPWASEISNRRESSTTTEIWRRARAQNLVIVSKDVDFYDRALLFGPPPQVVHVAVGNCSNARLFEIPAIEGLKLNGHFLPDQD